MKGENLISIDEVIERAKKLGVDFGKGNPKNRLRYYTKIGLIPHAQRKVFEKGTPEGAYPESVIDLLVEIDHLIKSGKSIQEIKRKILFPKEKKEKVKISFPKIGSKIFKIVVPAIFALSLFSFFFFPKAKNFLLSKLFQGEKIAQQATLPFSKKIETLSPFLTINADTLIRKSLRVQEKITSSALSLFKNFEGEILPANLTANRQYLLPDQSGTICLNSGNCFGIFGEVTSDGGTKNKLAKFIDQRKIADSSIQDLFSGVSIFIDEKGNVGIGTQTPKSKLDILGDLEVGGKIHATGDICTDEAGGKCLSRMITWFYGGGGGISGSGQAGYLPIWLAGNRLGQSILSQNGNEISISGILDLAKASEPSPTLGFGKIFVGNDGKLYFKDESGNLFDLTAASQAIQGQGTEGQLAIFSSTSTLTSTSSLSWDNQNQILNVDGTIVLQGFRLIPGAGEGKILMSDAQGYGVWASPPPGTMPPGALGQTMWHNGTSWAATSFLYNRADLQKIGIGTTTLSAMLTLAGDFNLAGPLQITDFLGQYFKISLLSNKAQIESTKNIVINSLTGQILTGPNVTLFDASSSTIKGLTFISADNDSTVRKSGEKVLRTMIPIFKFPLPAETASTSFVSVTREISTSTLNSLLPSQLPGSQRKFAILLNFADNIPTNNYSYWQIDFSNLADINFQFSGQGLSNLDEGISHLKDDLTNLLNDNWTLKVKVENANYKIRIFNAFLIVYDQIQ